MTDNENILKDINLSTDLLIENRKLDNENRILKEENEKLHKQVEITEKDAIELIDTIYETQYADNDNRCTFNTNGSCLFYDSFESQIKNCIEILNETRHRTTEIKVFEDINLTISKLQDILKRE